MRIAARYPAAREAQVARLAELQEQLAQVFAERFENSSPGDPQPHLMAGLTLTTLSATFRMWFHSDGQDVSVTAGKVLEQLHQLICDGQNARRNPERKGEAPKRRRA
jgi:hypothetical protein